jgi:hypothetical protein
MQVCHHSFDTQRRRCGEEFKQSRQGIEAHALTRHAGIDLKVHRHGMCGELAGAGGDIKGLDLPGLPHYGSQAVFDGCFGFAMPHAAHHEYAGLRSDRANGSALLNTGDTQPGVRILSDQDLRAGESVVSVAVGLDDGKQLRLASESAEQKVVFKKP